MLAGDGTRVRVFLFLPYRVSCAYFTVPTAMRGGWEARMAFSPQFFSHGGGAGARPWKDLERLEHTPYNILLRS